MKKLLLHTCCAPCASGCLGRLSGRDVVLYFSNSNIATEEEFDLRLKHVSRLAEIYRLELLVDEYDHEAWRNAVSAVPDFAEQPERGLRCTACFAWSLQRTAEMAESLGMNFATTLTVSPHKNSSVIFSIGKRYPHFEEWDFKKKDGFKESLILSKKYEFYRQTFCGCEYSLR